MKKFLAILIFASSSASGMIGEINQNLVNCKKRPILKAAVQEYFGSSVSTSGTSGMIDIQNSQNNDLNRYDTFGVNKEPDDSAGSFTDNEEYFEGIESELESSKETIDITRRRSVQLYYEGYNRRNSVQMHDERHDRRNSIQMYEEEPVENEDSYTSKFQKLFHHLKDLDEVIDVEQGIDVNAHRNGDWFGLFDLSEFSRSDSSKEDKKLVDIEPKVEEFQQLEEMKKRPYSYVKASEKQREIVQYLRSREKDIRKKIDTLNVRREKIREKSLKFAEENATQIWHWRLREEEQRILKELICLQESLRLSVKGINTKKSSEDMLNKIFIPSLFNEKKLKELQSTNLNLKGVLDRLTPNEGLTYGMGKVIHLNSLEDLTLDCGEILDMITLCNNKGDRIQLSLNCPNLRKLKVIGYNESNSAKQLIQSILCNAPELEELDISSNRLSSVDLYTLLCIGDWASNVEVLNLEDNLITGIPTLLSKCKNLEELNLRNNNLNLAHENSIYFIDSNSFFKTKGVPPKLADLKL